MAKNVKSGGSKKAATSAKGNASKKTSSAKPVKAAPLKKTTKSVKPAKPVAKAAKPVVKTTTKSAARPPASVSAKPTGKAVVVPPVKLGSARREDRTASKAPPSAGNEKLRASREKSQGTESFPSSRGGLPPGSRTPTRPSVYGKSSAEMGVLGDNPLMRNRAAKLPPRPVVIPPAPVTTDSKAKKNIAGLSTSDLENFRETLLATRRELLGDMRSMESEALRSTTGTNLSNLPLHMADMGTDNYEQEFTLGLMEKDRQLLREIYAALAKIQNGTFGMCEGTHQPISKARLEAQPWARYSIEYARRMETGKLKF